MQHVYFVIAAVLMLGAPALARVTPERYRGELVGGELGARLQRTAAYLQADAPGLADVPVEQLSRPQLLAEYQRLDSERPGLGAPIALTAVGGGLLLLGVVLFAYSAVAYVYSGAVGALLVAAYVLFAFSAVMGVTGAVLLTVGLVKLFTRIGQRRAYSQRMDDINARLESLDRSGAPPPPPPPDNLPPPPPPPGAWLFDVKPQLVVATF